MINYPLECGIVVETASPKYLTFKKILMANRLKYQQVHRHSTAVVKLCEFGYEKSSVAIRRPHINREPLPVPHFENDTLIL